MQSTLATLATAHAEDHQFRYEHSHDDSSPFDCSSTSTPTKLSTTTKPPTDPNKQKATMASSSDYSYEDGPSFDCQGPPLEMGEGIKVDLMMGSTPIKSNKSSKSNNNYDNAAAARDNDDDATVMTEPITPSPFKMMTPSASSMKKSSSFAGRRSSQQQPHSNEESPFDETPFDEGPSMMEEEDEDQVLRGLDTGVFSPTIRAKPSSRGNTTVAEFEEEEQEPGRLLSRCVHPSFAAAPPPPIDLEKRVSFQLPTTASATKSHRRNLSSTSAYSASTCEEEADPDDDLYYVDHDYEADVDHPYDSDEDDDDITLGSRSAVSENSTSLLKKLPLPPPAARPPKRKGHKKVVLTDLSNRGSNKPGIEEWCLSNVFDNIATDAALDVADWFTEGYTEGSKNVKTLVYDCLVPLQENKNCKNDGEEMIQLLRATDKRSDLQLMEEEEAHCATTPKKMPKSERRMHHHHHHNAMNRSAGTTMDDDSSELYHSNHHLRSKKADYSKPESNLTEVRTAETSSKLATPTVLTRTRSLLEDTPTKEPLYQEAPMVNVPPVTEGGRLVDNNRMDSTSMAAVTENPSIQQQQPVDQDENCYTSVEDTMVKPSLPPPQAQDETRQQRQQQQQEDDEDDDSVLDQAAEMAAVVGTMMSSSVPPPQQQQPEKLNSPEDRGSETKPPVAAEAAKTEGQPNAQQFKMPPMTTHKLTMAKAKDLLKAAKSNHNNSGGAAGIQTLPMFLEMEPEPKYADAVVPPSKQKKEWPPPPAKKNMFLEMDSAESKYATTDTTMTKSRTKKKEWPPKKTPYETSTGTNNNNMYKLPSARKSKPVDKFGYMAALKDKSNNNNSQPTKGNNKREEWW